MRDRPIEDREQRLVAFQGFGLGAPSVQDELHVLPPKLIQRAVAEHPTRRQLFPADVLQVLAGRVYFVPADSCVSSQRKAK